MSTFSPLVHLIDRLLKRYHNPNTKLGIPKGGTVQLIAKIIYYISPNPPTFHDRSDARQFIRDFWGREWTQEAILQQIQTTLEIAYDDVDYLQAKHLVLNSGILKITKEPVDPLKPRGKDTLAPREALKDLLLDDEVVTPIESDEEGSVDISHFSLPPAPTADFRQLVEQITETRSEFIKQITQKEVGLSEAPGVLKALRTHRILVERDIELLRLQIDIETCPVKKEFQEDLVKSLEHDTALLHQKTSNLVKLLQGHSTKPPLNKMNSEERTLPKLSPRCFDAQSEGVKSWASHFREVSAVNNWSEATQLKLLPLYLVHGPKRWYEMTKTQAEPPQTLDDWITKLINQYHDRGLVERSRLKLNTMRQGKDQKPLDFLNSFMDIVADADIKMEQSEMVRLLKLGLLPKVTRQLATNKVEHVNALKDALTQIEATDDLIESHNATDPNLIAEKLGKLEKKIAELTLKSSGKGETKKSERQENNAQRGRGNENRRQWNRRGKDGHHGQSQGQWHQPQRGRGGRGRARGSRGTRYQHNFYGQQLSPRTTDPHYQGDGHSYLYRPNPPQQFQHQVSAAAIPWNYQQPMHYGYLPQPQLTYPEENTRKNPQGGR